MYSCSLETTTTYTSEDPQWTSSVPEMLSENWYFSVVAWDIKRSRKVYQGMSYMCEDHASFNQAITTKSTSKISMAEGGIRFVQV